MQLDGANVLVVGMAKSGIASLELLRRRGARVTAADLNPSAGSGAVPQTPEVFEGRDLIVLSPGVPADLPELAEARRRGVRVIGDVELASWFLAGKVLGITGSNGKTTTTALTGHILKAAGIACQVGGNIGTPLGSLIDSSRDGQWNVLELSSFQLETIDRFHVSIAAALNVTPDHLDRHHSFTAYAAAKARIFENQDAGDHAVLNAGDPVCADYAARTRARVTWFAYAKPAGVSLENGRLLFEGRPFLDVRDIPLAGAHNVENVMAAAAAAQLAGADLEAIAAAVRTFPGVPHRLELIRALRGVSYYNDSKATNVDATLKAIAAFPGGLWIILGGKDKDSDYRVLHQPLAGKAKGVLLIGAAARKIEEHLREAGSPLPVEHAGTLENAILAASARAAAGDTVLLAPACASFDQFRNYEHRGETFRRLVETLE